MPGIFMIISMVRPTAIRNDRPICSYAVCTVFFVPADLFKVPPAVLATALQSSFGTARDEYGNPASKRCDIDFAASDAWRPVRQGLGIVVPLLGCGDYATSGRTYVIPWSALASYLKRSPAISLADLPTLR